MEHEQAIIMVEQADLHNVTAEHVEAAMMITQSNTFMADTLFKKCVDIIYQYDMQGLKLWHDIEKGNNV